MALEGIFSQSRFQLASQGGSLQQAGLIIQRLIQPQKPFIGFLETGRNLQVFVAERQESLYL